jgi:hypothetical protein
MAKKEVRRQISRFDANKTVCYFLLAVMAKFARGNRYSQMEYQEKYKEDCRKIFETQSKTLACMEWALTDNENSADEDSDVDEMTKNLESMLGSSVSRQATESKSNTDHADGTKKSVRIVCLKCLSTSLVL